MLNVLFVVSIVCGEPPSAVAIKDAIPAALATHAPVPSRTVPAVPPKGT